MRLEAKQAKQAHQRVAIFLGLFLAVHFATHFAAIGGIEAQDTVMQAGRAVYRIPIVEIALVLALAMQVYLGVDLLRRIAKRARKDIWHRMQFASGCYLAFFIVMHTTAAFVSRLGFSLDTNFFWAAGTLALEPLLYVFTPYYTFAVIALVTHLVCALHFRSPRKWHVPMLAIGPIAGILIILAYGGAFFPVELPKAYEEYFGTFPGVGD